MKKYVMTFCFILIVISCQKPVDRYPGLIGAYYGNADFTNVKEPLLLSNLNQLCKGENNHGSEWSAVWEGFVVAPVSGEIAFHLKSNRRAILELGRDSKTEVHPNEQAEPLNLTVQQGSSYPIRLSYVHDRGGIGELTVRWSWAGNPPVDIPWDHLFFTQEQAMHWNYRIEPLPDEIEPNRFLTVDARHVIVYHEPGRFGGWPANNGIWSWGDEILVGFNQAYYQSKVSDHSIDREKPSYAVLARSLDGGETWTVENPDHFVGDGGKAVPLNGGIQFSHPDFVLRCGGDQFFQSYDRGKTWQGPCEFPDFGTQKLTSRTDYLVGGDNDALIFISAEEPRAQSKLADRAFCVRAIDGGKSFQFLSWISDSIIVRSVMPSTVRLSENHLVTAMRRRHDKPFPDKPAFVRNWIDVHRSLDDGRSWQYLGEVAETDMGKHNGNPPSMVRLKDGRLCVTYGYRAVPYGIRAKISADDGKTWSREINLRDDARTWDIGYTRSVQRSDGKIVTIYYYTSPTHIEQHIEASIWDPGQIR